MSHQCGSCSCSCSPGPNPEKGQGCVERLDDARREEEISSAPYLIFAGIVIFLVSLAFKLIFVS